MNELANLADLLDVAADRLGVHIIIRYGLIARTVVDIGEAVGRFVDITRLGIIYPLIAEGGVALLLAHDILAFAAAFPGGHDAVHRLVEILTDLHGLRHGFIAGLIGGADEAVRVPQRIA